MRSIEKILFREPRGVLSLTGGGGKTSLMFQLARLLVRQGKRVLTTTTTKIFFPTPEQSTTVLIDTDPKMILAQAKSCLDVRHISAAAARMDGTHKLKGFNPEAIRIFEEAGLFDWILVEADGSARRSLKAPADHEPVVPANTTVLVAVAGLEVLGCRLCEELVFRSELAGNRMQLSRGMIITEVELARLLAHPLGSLKGAPPRARRFIFLNKADDQERRVRGARVAEQLLQMNRPVAESLIVGQVSDRIYVHAEYPLEAVP